MGQLFKNRNELEEFVRAMTAPVSSSDWNIALSNPGPILRQFLAVQEQEIAKEVAIDRMIENILTYMAKQDKIERAEQFALECSACRFVQQRVNGPSYRDSVDSNVNVKMNLELLNLMDLKVAANQLATQFDDLTQRKDDIVEVVALLNEKMNEIDVGWKDRQDKQAAAFVSNIKNAFDPYDEKLVGSEGALIKLTPLKLTALEAAHKIASPVDILRINPDQAMDADSMVARGDFLRQMKANLVLFRKDERVDEEFDAAKDYLDTQKELQKNNIKFKTPTPARADRVKDKKDVEDCLNCHQAKKEKEAEKKMVEQDISLVEKALDKANQLIRHAEMLILKPDDRKTD